MRVPIRKPGKYAEIKPDRHITQAKFAELQAKLARLLASRPAAIEEVQKYAFEGDFSENAPYQIAKGRLRSINQKILEIEEALRQAEIIKNNGPKDRVELGSSVTVEINKQIKSYRILGSAETDPRSGIISYRSPFGAALMGHSSGELIKIRINNKEIICRIIKIE